MMIFWRWYWVGSLDRCIDYSFASLLVYSTIFSNFFVPGHHYDSTWESKFSNFACFKPFALIECDYLIGGLKNCGFCDEGCMHWKSDQHETFGHQSAWLVPHISTSNSSIRNSGCKQKRKTKWTAMSQKSLLGSIAVLLRSISGSFPYFLQLTRCIQPLLLLEHTSTSVVSRIRCDTEEAIINHLRFLQKSFMDISVCHRKVLKCQLSGLNLIINSWFKEYKFLNLGRGTSAMHW